MKTLKIGITCYPSIGGSGIVATNLGIELARLGHQVHFISYEKPFKLNGNSKNIYFHKVRINEYELFKYPDYTLPLAVKMDEVDKKYELDILHVHYAVPHATAALLARQLAILEKCKAPEVITTLHGTDITLLGNDPSLQSIIKYSIESSSGVTAVSNSLKQETIKVLKTHCPIEVIYNFYTPSPITQPRNTVRKGLKIKDNDLLITHISNLRPVKRIPDLLKIIAKLKNQNIKLLILAGGNFKQYLPLVKKLGIAEKIIVKNNVFDIDNYLNASDLGIYTSEKESFGLGVLETMSHGKPVLATNIGGMPEVIENEKSGYLLPLGKVDAFANKIKYLIKNPQALEVLGQNAKKRAAQFSTEVMVKKYLDYYKKILD